MVFGLSKRDKEQEAADDADTAPPVEEGATWSGQGDASLPTYTQEGSAYTVHVYKANGAFRNDLLVTSSSKDKVLYYLRLSSGLGHSWNPKDAVLHEGYKDGPIVATFDKPNMFKTSNIKVEYFAGNRTEPSGSKAAPTQFTLTSSQKVGDDHEFQVGDARFKWHIPLASRMTLVDLQTGEQAAEFEESVLSTKKSGKLTVQPAFLPHLELIIVTAVAMDRHRSQKRAERAAASSAGGSGGSG